MRFTFTEKKITTSEALRRYAETKVGKLDRYFQSEAEANITCSVERGRHVAEVTVRSDGMFYRASETTDDMYASIDAAVAALERQMRKNKTRLEKRLREGAFLKEQNAAVISPEEPEEETEFEIVRSKRFPIKPMTPEEAILQMNLLDHTFFVFRNQDNDEHVAVVYRRNNGGYGLIEED
jgi:putative sigma-54 modulation protein